MKPMRDLAQTASTLLAVVILAVFSLEVAAQDTRPRYSSPQYADQSLTVPADTVISVQMNTTLSSRTAHVGDRFNATVTVPVYVNGRTVIPAGSIIEGRVTQVTPAKRMNRSGTIAIDFDDLVFPNGTQVALVGSLTSDDAETRRQIDEEGRVSAHGNKRPEVFIGAGGAIGAVLGGIAGGGKGAAVGGILGAGAGVASVLLSKGEEAQVPAGTPFGVQLKQQLVIRDTYVADGMPTSDRSPDQQTYRPDRSADRPERSADRSERSEVGALPENTDRAARTERPELGREAEHPVSPAPTALPLSSPEMVRRAQGALKDQGYYEGETDGAMSPRTSGALKTYQREHNLPETGDLDPQTAKSLGIVGATSGGDRAPEQPKETTRESAEPPEPEMANVLSATANRTREGSIYVLINTQANTGGWRWFGEQVVNGDTLEVYARAQRPSGMTTQVLTRGRIELTVRDGVEYVRRVVIHSAAADQVIALGGNVDVSRESGAVREPNVGREPSAGRDPSVTRDANV
ncbi:MAG: peptidoglycan-binding domain-containing protein, partial [Blastocatellia bacterium]